MGRVKRDRKPDNRQLCSDSLTNAVALSSKLLDSADASDKMTKQIFLYFQRNSKKLIHETKCLRHQKQELIRELSVANEKLEIAEEANRKLKLEAQRLQKNLEAIREVLKDSDIDKAKERLAQIEDISWMRSPTPKKSRLSRNQHSAGSLLDSDNTSSASDAENRNIESTEHIPGSGRKRVSNENTIPNNSSSLKRRTLDNTEGYQDVSFKKLVVDTTLMDDEEECGSMHSDDPMDDPGRGFKTPEPPKKIVGNRLTRLHEFLTISSLRLGLCSCCGKRFNIGRTALRCKVCRLTVHGHCQHQLKQRCVPPIDLSQIGSPKTPGDILTSPMTSATINRLKSSVASPMTPSSTLRRHAYPWHTLSLSALCPSDESPRIPAAIILCVNEVASRGLIQLGIYRVPGADRKVHDLLDKFLYSRTTPSLALIEDINVICSCLKTFLRLLDEPLVTRALRSEFVAAGEIYNTDPESAKYLAAELIERLPVANRDTLAFLLLHLKDVARSTSCKMSETNLAKVFGQNIVGHSCVDPSLSVVTSEVPAQIATVRLLLAVPDAVYSAIIG